MDFSVQRTKKQTVTIYGVAYEVAPLTALQREELIEGQEKLGESKVAAMKFSKEFMAKRGIPIEVLDDMEPEHWDSLLMHFIGQLSKKN